MAETHAADGSSYCARSGICRVATACAPAKTPLCYRVLGAHGGLLAFCEELEAVADSLPLQVEPLRCLRIANGLVPLLRRAHRLEEEFLFPAFERAARPAGDRSATIHRLRAEHVYDACSAEALTEVLLEMGHGASVCNAEALGYMLRAFFDAVRRHIAFEQEHILKHSRTPARPS